MSKMQTITELWSFLSARKRLWLLPVVVLLVALGVLVVVAEGSALAPFIYTLF